MPDSSASDDSGVSVDGRVDGLLQRMTLAEKAAQLGLVNVNRILRDDGTLDEAAVEEHLGEGIGHLTRIGGEESLPPREAAERVNELQRYLEEETRLGVPAIPHEECLSGYMGPAGTTFSQGIGMASTWSPALMRAVTEAIRSQLEAIGTAHALSPVLDVARDLRWGRVEETFGEEPYLVAAMACGYVDGLQGDGDGIAATLEHFAGHGAGAGGKNRSSVDIGRRELRETHLFPFEAAVHEADAESVMNAYHDVDGVPCASDEWLLTDVLRGEWEFDGTVVSDYYSVEYLRSEHGVRPTSARRAWRRSRPASTWSSPTPTATGSTSWRRSRRANSPRRPSTPRSGASSGRKPRRGCSTTRPWTPTGRPSRSRTQRPVT